ncbi:hypothetical protein [Endozoicomonas sp. ONNA2]|uniref:hypothetical protein n=1 Tax=Endozoicomonas sp. ONNA2 TaxID=2828741 RepID=UPI0021487764|nr:hypothetical protein [Endozoicomonas sp. ONNA2]
MNDILKKIIFVGVALFFPLLTASTAFSDGATLPAPPISASFIMANSDGTETRCIVTGSETQEELKSLLEAGCTLETLRKNDDIDIEVTLKTNSGFKTVLMTSKYYLMWLNSGLHAVNILRRLPFAFTSLASRELLNSAIYLGFSGLYSFGYTRNANQTLYPFLGKNLSSFFYPDGKKDSNSNETESLGFGGHTLIIGSDLITWWLDDALYGFNINRLMLGMDLLHLALDIAI